MRNKDIQKRPLSAAIKKYGWEKFTVEILEECKTKEELNEREKYWIAKLNTKVPNGYNMTDGGEGGTGCPNRFKMKVICVETGEEFKFINTAAQHYKISPNRIASACNNIEYSAAG